MAAKAAGGGCFISGSKAEPSAEAAVCADTEAGAPSGPEAGVHTDAGANIPTESGTGLSLGEVQADSASPLAEAAGGLENALAAGAV